MNRYGCVSKSYPLVKTNMAMENGPNFEDVFPMENGDFPVLCKFTGV